MNHSRPSRAIALSTATTTTHMSPRTSLPIVAGCGETSCIRLCGVLRRSLKSASWAVCFGLVLAGAALEAFPAWARTAGSGSTSLHSSDGVRCDGGGSPAGSPCLAHNPLPGTSVLATFSVMASVGTDMRWVYSPSSITTHLGPAVLWDASGTATGYRTTPNSRGAVVESRSWSNDLDSQWHYPFVAYAVALFANNSNPPLRVDKSSGMITPGYVSDLGAYNMGHGPGWVAVDSTTGNALLLRVVARTLGSPICGKDGTACLARGTSALGSMNASDFAHFVTDDPGFISGFTGAIVSDLPFVGYACSLNPAATTSTATCLGGDLGVTITPVGVVRGDVLGVKLPRAGSGTTDLGAWSPGGSYSLSLTGVSVYN